MNMTMIPKKRKKDDSRFVGGLIDDCIFHCRISCRCIRMDILKGSIMMIMALNLPTIYGPIAVFCLLAFWLYIASIFQSSSFNHQLEAIKKDIRQQEKHHERMQREIDILREDIKIITDSIGDIKASTDIIFRIESDLKEMRSEMKPMTSMRS